MKKVQNYYFEVVSPEKAKALFREGTELYKIFEDDERPIEGMHDLEDAIDLGIELAIQNPIG